MLKEQNLGGVSDANTYVTAVELENYAALRGITLASEDLTPLLVKAMDYLEAREYRGQVVNNSQSTKFPRVGYGIPSAIKKAQLQLAVIADSTDLMPNIIPSEQVVKREKIDVLETEYVAAATTPDNMPVFSHIDALLAPYLLNGGNGAGLNFKVSRG